MIATSRTPDGWPGEVVYQAKAATVANLKADDCVLILFVYPSIPTRTPFNKAEFEWAYYARMPLSALFSELDFAGRVEGPSDIEGGKFPPGCASGGKVPRQINPAVLPLVVMSSCLPSLPPRPGPRCNLTEPGRFAGVQLPDADVGTGEPGSGDLCCAT